MHGNHTQLFNYAIVFIIAYTVIIQYINSLLYLCCHALAIPQSVNVGSLTLTYMRIPNIKYEFATLLRPYNNYD